MQFAYFINLDCSNCSGDDEDCVCESKESSWLGVLVLGVLFLAGIAFLVSSLDT